MPTFTWGKSGKSAGYVAANAPYYSSAYTKYTSYPAILEASDDAATAAWGSGWRMPTQTELAILYNACDNGSITSKSSAISLTGSVQSKGIYLCLNADGVKGALFSDGTNQIFFPDARFVEGTSLYDEYDYSMYWSSSLQSGNNAYYLYLDFDYSFVTTTAQGERCKGALVRPVRNELAPVPGGDAVTKITGISLSPTSCSLSIGGTQTLTATITPSGATIQDLLWTSSNTSVATVSSAGLVTTLSSGTATITATATDGSGKSATCTVTVIDVLPGKFTVNSSGKQVYFSTGNLYWNGSAFMFETNQYDYPDPTSKTASHIGHFYWSKTASVAYASSYSESGTAASDVLFTNATAETPNAGFSVNGLSNIWRSLSKAEWEYLLGTRTVTCGTRYVYSTSGITVAGTKYCGIFIFPDDYSGSATTSAMSSLTWAQIKEAGIVYIPAAGGDGYDDNTFNIWCSDTSGANNANIWYPSNTGTITYTALTRSCDYSIRLVMDAD